ncbi:hypothetical protein P9265_07575 [Schinkia azotoformans]|uniref:hypothetical protein n=1 Tax=Schinkia azotoformans TaxID=1454 RepID=UPI002E1B071F|nr:hypothetical protein [Schinkia azotoformans]
MLVKLKSLIKNISLKPKLLDALKWYYIDLYRYVRDRKTRPVRIKEHGVFTIVGETGGGKTTLAVYLIDKMIKKYGRDNIYICSNTDFKGQDFKVEHWGDLTLFYNKPLVFVYDECNSDWTQNSYKELDLRLRTALTQNRKGMSKMVLALTQDYEMLLNEWRRLSKFVYICKTRLERYTSFKMYDREDFEELISTKEIKKKMKIRPKRRESLVQTDDFRSNYNSYGLVKSIKKPFSEYVIRKELLNKIDLTLTDLSEYQIEY